MKTITTVINKEDYIKYSPNQKIKKCFTVKRKTNMTFTS